MKQLPDLLHRVVIIGAGVSGLSLAYRLERLGIVPAVLDGAPSVGETWRQRHPQLRLNTHRSISHLPGMPLPTDAGEFASREAFVSYLEGYAARLSCPIALGVQVARLDRNEDVWRLQTSAGQIVARQVVIATGRERAPVLPDWPGKEQFLAPIVHASHFGDVGGYQNRAVLVVGGGNSGVDILNQLSRVRTRSLWLSIRRGTTIIPLRLGLTARFLAKLPGALPDRWMDRLLDMTERTAYGDLTQFGLPPSRGGAATRLSQEGIAPAIDDGFVRALKKGRVNPVPAIARFDGRTVELINGARLQPDVVVCATGYAADLERIVGHLGVLCARGLPRFRGGVPDPALPGLWFLGFEPHIFGTIHAARRESGRLAKCIAALEGGGSHHSAAKSPRAGLAATAEMGAT